MGWREIVVGSRPMGCVCILSIKKKERNVYAVRVGLILILTEKWGCCTLTGDYGFVCSPTEFEVDGVLI